MKRFLIPFLLAPTIAVAEPVKSAQYQIGGWEVAQYHDQGQYTHCIMSTAFQARTAAERKEMRTDFMILVFKINVQNKLIITVGSPDWKLNPQNKYKLRLEFPNGVWHDLTDTPDDEKTLAYILDMDKLALELFGLISSESSVRLLINGESLGGFNLVKSRKAMDALVQCHDTNMKEQKTNTDPSFGGGVSGGETQ